MSGEDVITFPLGFPCGFGADFLTLRGSVKVRGSFCLEFFRIRFSIDSPKAITGGLKQHSKRVEKMFKTTLETSGEDV
jgi:hypothetical protein